jgi:hypothetical protein
MRRKKEKRDEYGTVSVTVQANRKPVEGLFGTGL